MDVADLYLDALSRITAQVPAVVADLDEDALAWRPDPEANSIAWLVWHLTRVGDRYSAEYSGGPLRWTEGGWHERFGLPFPPEASGYGMTSDEVGSVRVGGELLAGYYADVEPAVRHFLSSVTPADLDRVVDENYDPPVTLGVRLVSMINDMTQHAGQAAYVRGMLDRRG